MTFKNSDLGVKIGITNISTVSVLDGMLVENRISVWSAYWNARNNIQHAYRDKTLGPLGYDATT
jgi:hypothetical protein